MKLAIKAVLIAAAALTLALVGAAFAIDTEPVLGFAGAETGTLSGVGKGEGDVATNYSCMIRIARCLKKAGGLAIMR